MGLLALEGSTCVLPECYLHGKLSHCLKFQQLEVECPHIQVFCRFGRVWIHPTTLLFPLFLTWERPLWWPGFMLKGRMEGPELLCGPTSLRGGSAVRGLGGLTLELILCTGTLLRVTRNAVDNFAESTKVNWDCLGQTGPYGYPSWGQCERARV